MSVNSDDDEEAIETLLGERYHDKLTSWEDGFLNGLLEQGWMSVKQREIFDRIWEEVVVQRSR